MRVTENMQYISIIPYSDFDLDFMVDSPLTQTTPPHDDHVHDRMLFQLSSPSHTHSNIETSQAV